MLSFAGTESNNEFVRVGGRYSKSGDTRANTNLCQIRIKANAGVDARTILVTAKQCTTKEPSVRRVALCCTIGIIIWREENWYR